MKKLLTLVVLSMFIFTACKKETLAPSGNNGKSGSITRFTVYNGYMYVLDQNKILTYSLSNTQAPVLVNELATDYGLETIIVYESFVYIGSRTALYILDITDPAKPFVLSKTDRSILVIGGCDPVVVKNQYAYSTIKIIENRCGNINTASELEVFDITNKSNPVLVFSYPLSEPNGLGYSDNYLFVCDEGADEISIFDISNPLNPVLSGNISLTDPVDLIINGNRMIVSTKTDFFIYSIGDIHNITLSGTIAKL